MAAITGVPNCIEMMEEKIFISNNVFATMTDVVCLFVVVTSKNWKKITHCDDDDDDDDGQNTDEQQ
jgi:hypothetical protein